MTDANAALHAESRMLIDGELVDSASGKTYDNINPFNEEVAGQVADAEPQDMARAITAARRSFDDGVWANDLDLRIRCLNQLHDALDARREELRPQIITEVGAPKMLTYAVQMDSCIDDMKYDIDLAATYTYEEDLPLHEFFGMRSNRRIYKEPVGVIGAITPWNFPFMLNLSKIVPALAAGNTVILKPAPDTPWSATWLGKMVAEHTDIPAGVFNVVTNGEQAAIGEMLTTSPDVDMITFTGSTATGKRIMAAGADTVKRVFLELGGKSANIVLDDADFPGSLSMGAMVCIHGGQGCAITTRYLLPRSRYDEGVEILKTSFENFAYGDPNDDANLMGPLINKRQYDKVLGMIEAGKAEGAKAIVGGKASDKFEKGYFVEPTLFVDVDNSMSIARNEIFGPVLVVIPYDDDDDAVRIANDTRFGLSGSITGTNLERSLAIAKRVRAGTLSVNGGQYFGPDAPFGGYKESGIGREHGVAGFEEYLQTKALGLPE
jgi:aldehyde dehydrogenase (NAD+)